MDDTKRTPAFLPLSPAEFDILLVLAGGDHHGYGILKEAESLPRSSIMLTVNRAPAIVLLSVNMS